MKNILFAFAMLLAATSSAQDNTEDSEPFTNKGLFNGKCTLPSGTLIILETTEKIFSDQVTVGKTIQFRVRTNVIAEKEVVIRTGALALGRVKSIEPSTYNNPEDIRIELQYVQAVDGQMVPLSGQEESLRGQFTGQGTAVETGTSLTAYVMNEVKIKAD
ncbi:MAG: hypothetical protein EPGJADBJ_03404 [Saprospiraceae bacterium]|nr:hypothetical protein [Saprospiraceae bacterium]